MPPEPSRQWMTCGCRADDRPPKAEWHAASEAPRYQSSRAARAATEAVGSVAAVGGCSQPANSQSTTPSHYSQLTQPSMGVVPTGQ